MPPPATEANNAQNVILHAEKTTFLGLFTVSATQIKPHPYQRPLDAAWVHHLKKCFMLTMDRSTHYIKAILKTSNDANHIMQIASSVADTQDPPHIPEGIELLVFDGQHRIVACLQLEDVKEHWWIVKVYHSNLEHAYPAEFIGMMHSANNPMPILETSDALRLKGMYRLQTLLKDGKISQEAYVANRTRVTGDKEAVMRGLNNICANYGLLEAVHGALLNRHVAASFSASSWKGLTTGRFYGILIYLLAEMVQQVNIIQGDAVECSSKPFMLKAKVTTFDHLESTDNNHPWRELPGGPEGAVARLRMGPSGCNFTTPLIKEAGNKWSLPDRAFIPTVMGSNIITDRLEIMYEIAQHLVHIVAGTKALERYISNRGSKDEGDHPFGIFTQVLGRKVMGEGGKPGNGAMKILLRIWLDYSSLKRGLQDFSINRPKASQPEEYQNLANGDESWWTLLSTFKIKRFEKGLGITISKQFGPSPHNVLPSHPLTLGIMQEWPAVPLQGTSDETYPSITELESGSSIPQQEQQCNEDKVEPLVPSQEALEVITDPQPESYTEQTTRAVETAAIKTPRTRNPQIAGQKRRRNRGKSVDGDNYTPPRASTRLKGPGSTATLGDEIQSSDQELNAQIHRLTGRAGSMCKTEASSIATLLGALQDIDASVVVDANQMLLDLIPKVVAKAQKRKLRISQAYDDDDDPTNIDSARVAGRSEGAM
ncbi:hypothetical protein FRC11_008753 [Ceratobasidium sp. 423]|nr:hypothetical protein FRC11_008753 [Ceratobasidium sp. 423]